MMGRKPGLPYEGSTAGAKAFDEIERLLRKFGCTNFGRMTDWDRGASIVVFEHRGRKVHMEASWKGYAEMWLKAHPYSFRSKGTRQHHEMKARQAGEMAVPSILRDMIKGQITAVECGLMPLEHAFLPHMLLPDGRRLADAADQMLALPAPKE
jgi:hypothetical protein